MDERLGKFLDERAYDHLRSVAEHPEALKAIEQHSFDETAIKEPFRLPKKVADAAQMQQDDVLAILTAIHNMRNYIERFPKERKELFQAVDKLFKNHFAEESDLLKKWDDVLHEFESICGDSSSYALFEKALELRSSYRNIYAYARVFTDVRPIFDSQASELLNSYVTNILTISYTEGSQVNRLDLAIDEEDLFLLKEQLERALQKNQTIAREFGEKNLPFILDRGR